MGSQPLPSRWGKVEQFLLPFDINVLTEMS